MSVQTLTRSGLVAGIMLVASGLAPSPGNSGETKTAIFAGGCFWCVESDFDQVEGVVETVSGYIGGTLKNPGYKQVSAGGTGHYEAVKITYDPARVTYEALLTVFWHSVDPTDAGGQFCDRGESYRTAIFATDEAQLEKAAAPRKYRRITRECGQRRCSCPLRKLAGVTVEFCHRSLHVFIADR